MTEAQSPFTAFDQGFMQAAKFYQINNTYEIRDFANGLFFELFKILERELNFTAHILKRKDSGWGGKNSDWPNGKNLNTLFDLHIVWKLLKMSHLNVWILSFSTNFCPIKTHLSGNTVWTQASGFQKLAKMDHFRHF